MLMTVLPPRPRRLSQPIHGVLSRPEAKTPSIDGPPTSSMTNGIDASGRLEDAEWYWGDISRYELVWCVSYKFCADLTSLWYYYP